MWMSLFPSAAKIGLSCRLMPWYSFANALLISSFKILRPSATKGADMSLAL
jgi:hypothetical protein